MRSFTGWEQYFRIQRGAIDSRRAFMAMPYGDTELDALVKDVFRPAVAQTGFDLIRLDELPRAGLIDDRLRVEIRGCRFLLADLPHGNNGAYWEAGYAEGLGKPVIYTCEKAVFDAEQSHFDTITILPWCGSVTIWATPRRSSRIRFVRPFQMKRSCGTTIRDLWEGFFVHRLMARIDGSRPRPI